MLSSKVKEQLLKHSQVLLFNTQQDPSKKMPKWSLNPSTELNIKMPASKHEKIMCFLNSPGKSWNLEGLLFPFCINQNVSPKTW